jgi:hypothetical protein
VLTFVDPILTEPNMSRRRIFKVIFVNQGKIYELYARRVDQGSLYGFVEVEELQFNERSAVVVDPAEERLKEEFAGVTRTYLPMHSVIRIDEVEKPGVGKIRDGSGIVTPFPGGLYGGGEKSRKD